MLPSTGCATCAAMMKRLLAVGSMVHSMTLSYSQLPALRELPVGLAEAVHHRTLRRSLVVTRGIRRAHPDINLFFKKTRTAHGARMRLKTPRSRALMVCPVETPAPDGGESVA